MEKFIHEVPGHCFMYEFLFKSPFNFRNITFSYNIWAKWLEQALGIFGRPGRNVVSLPGPPSSPMIELSAGGVGFSWRVVVFPLPWWTEWLQLPLGGCDVSSPRFHPVFGGSCCGAIIYLPWLRTVLHPAGMCVKVPLSPQNLQYTVDPLSCFICAGLLELVGCHTLIEAGKRFGKALVSGVHSTWTCVKLLDYTYLFFMFWS